MPGKPRIGIVEGEDYTADNGVLKCSRCTKSFPHNRFYNLKGIPPPPHIYSLISLMHFLVHVNTVHKQEKLFTCNVCDSSFGTKGNLQKHTESEHDIKSWRCEKCSDGVFNSKAYLDKHMKDRHLKKKVSRYLTKKFIKE